MFLNKGVARCSPATVDEDHIHPVVLEAYRRKIFFDLLNLAVERV
jgi:hypothetical protein